MALMRCEECGKEYSRKAEKCPDCGNPNPLLEKEQKKKESKKMDVLIALLLFFTPTALIGIIMMWVKKIPRGAFTRIIATLVFGVIFMFWVSTLGGSGSSSEPSDSNPQKVSNVSNEQSDESKTEKKEEQEEEQEDKVFKKGDVVETSDYRITYISGKKYKSDNEFLKPKKGNVYYEMKFEFENISDSDKSLSSMVGWTCYADSYKVDQAFIGEDNGLDVASLSAGKKAKGSVFFEVPKDTKEITLVYECNFFTSDKIVFKVK